jgi:phage shock protein C
MDTARRCPYCAEEIAPQVTRCPHCRSRVATFDPADWHRDHPERRLAGVATAMSHALALPLMGVRVAFIALTFIHFIGPILYGALWLIVPYALEDDSLLERGLGHAKDVAGELRGRRPERSDEADRHDVPGGIQP